MFGIGKLMGYTQTWRFRGASEDLGLRAMGLGAMDPWAGHHPWPALVHTPRGASAPLPPLVGLPLSGLPAEGHSLPHPSLSSLPRSAPSE